MGLFTRLEKFDQSLRVVMPAGALGVADANSDPRGIYFFTVCRNINLGSSNWRSHIGDP